MWKCILISNKLNEKLRELRGVNLNQLCLAKCADIEN